jgi:hypothetical protein
MVRNKTVGWALGWQPNLVKYRYPESSKEENSDPKFVDKYQYSLIVKRKKQIIHMPNP